MRSVKRVIAVEQNFTRSGDRLLTTSPRYVMVTCITLPMGTGLEKGVGVRSSKTSREGGGGGGGPKISYSRVCS